LLDSRKSLSGLYAHDVAEQRLDGGNQCHIRNAQGGRACYVFGCAALHSRLQAV